MLGSYGCWSVCSYEVANVLDGSGVEGLSVLRDTHIGVLLIEVVEGKALVSEDGRWDDVNSRAFVDAWDEVKVLDLVD